MNRMYSGTLSGMLCLVLLSAFNSGPSEVIKEKESRSVGLEKTVSNTAAQGWRPLFNGKDLTGWKHVGKGSMSVEDGLIRGHGGMGLLYYTGEKFSNCTIRVVYKMQKENSNSGVFIRIPIEPREEWMPVFYGYEVQIDNNPEASNEDDTHATGCLYSMTKALSRPGKPGPQWNTMEITLDGLRTIVTVNGVKVTDYKEGDPVPERKFDFEPFRGPRPLAGFIGLQNHGEDDVVYFKEVSVKPLAGNKAKGR
ncbi:3-keto-disaccharide hydrolase [Flavisolibacter nicotianae]|uniref:3-keto-disaccharide hydrolase n=1 Tax=Flavisolibacter nicotianae TaxID=2364882 RepID=UPI001969084A|nr:DUF1080 domain-containing protein [Flavisolibacter nicotianae]